VLGPGLHTLLIHSVLGSIQKGVPPQSHHGVIVLFHLKNFLSFREVELELGNVTLLIGNDDSGVLELGRAIIAMNTASLIKDPYLAFLRLFGTSPLELSNSLSIVLDSIKLLFNDEKIEFEIGTPRWSHTVFMPSDRVGITRLLINVLEASTPTSYITLENVIEHVYSPIRFFLNTIIPPYEVAPTSERCFELLVEKLKTLKEKIGTAKTIHSSELDNKLMELALEASKEHDVIYIEDPGVFKPVRKAKETTQDFLRKALEKKVDVIIITYRSAPLYALSGLVERGEVSPSQVKAYHVYKEGDESRVTTLTIEEGVGILPEDMKFIVEIMP